MLFWHTPVLLPVLLISWPFYVLFALAFRRTMTIEIPLCSRHLWQRRILSLTGIVLIPTAVWMGYVAIANSKPTLILSGILSVMIGAILIGLGRNPIWAIRMKNDHALVKGIHPSIQENLPHWKGEEL
jgi:hypothetical protein